MTDFNNQRAKPRILVAPLDWGLGHATRCVPIILELVNQGCDVYIVGDKSIFYLLKQEFPSCVFLRCKGYEIKYGRGKTSFFSTLILQLPKIIFTVIREHRWLKKTVKEHQINAIISDNRFGMYHKKIHSIYITHQLQIKTGSVFADIIAQKIHYFFINKYSACWVPDEREIGIGGELSHPKKTPANIDYIGILSRFHSMSTEKLYDILITISGPEPQRTLFERKVLEQLKEFSGSVLLVRGLPDSNSMLTSNNPLVKIVNHLSAAELNESLEQSTMIIGRSGYTTIMDLAALKRKAILIPTPGQTEQEYLAEYLFKRNYFFCVEEEEFSIETALKEASSFEFRAFYFSSEVYKKSIKEFVLSLKSVNFASQ